MDCACCFEDIDIKIKYRDRPEGEWKECPYCKECILYMKEHQFLDYVKQVEQETCEKSLKRLIEMGPPLKVREPVLLPCENKTDEVYEFDCFSSNLEHVYPHKKLSEYIEKLKEIEKLIERNIDKNGT